MALTYAAAPGPADDRLAEVAHVEEADRLAHRGVLPDHAAARGTRSASPSRRSRPSSRRGPRAGRGAGNGAARRSRHRRRSGRSCGRTLASPRLARFPATSHPRGRTPVTTVSLSSSKPAALKVDALVVGVAKGPDGVVLAPGARGDRQGVQGPARGRRVEALGGTGAAGEVTKVSALGAVTAPRGRGRRARPPEPSGRGRRATTTYGARCCAGPPVPPPARSPAPHASASRCPPATRARSARSPRARCSAPTRSAATARPRPTSTRPRSSAFTLVTGSPRDRAAKAAVARARHRRSPRSTSCRDLVNTPPGDLPPAEFADAAVAAAKEAGVSVEVIDEKALQEGRVRRHPRRRPGLRRGRRGWSGSPTRHAEASRTWRSSARASRSTPAASRSSRRPRWSG